SYRVLPGHSNVLECELWRASSSPYLSVSDRPGRVWRLEPGPTAPGARSPGVGSGRFSRGIIRSGVSQLHSLRKRIVGRTEECPSNTGGFERRLGTGPQCHEAVYRRAPHQGVLVRLFWLAA